MPSHTFTRLGYWQASIDGNVAAAAAARRQGQTAEELHASDYETYAYLQTGQDEAAARIVRSLPEIASRFDPKAVLIGAGHTSLHDLNSKRRNSRFCRNDIASLIR